MSQYQEIRADFDRETITVYQAYHDKIAIPAVTNNKFEPPFSFNRMTWIKPSFLWLMERSNWATKPNQEHILAIKIGRNYWEEALSLGVLTHPDSKIYSNGAEWQQKFDNAKIHIQWDPERTIRGAKLEIRSIQVGISRFLIQDFNEKWIKEIVDYTPLVKKMRELLKIGKYPEAQRLLPKEKVYDLPPDIKQRIGAD
jgi:Domain of unknown function (DUF4291)